MPSSFAQLDTAAQQHNWEAVLQGLQDVLSNSSDKTADQSAERDIQPRYLELALDVLYLGDFQLRWEIAKLMPRFGDGAIAPLVSLLQDEDTDDDWELVWFVARILGAFPHPEAIVALTQFIQTTTNADLAQEAALALVNQGKRAIAPLTHLLQQDHTKRYIAQAIAQTPDPYFVELLRPMTGDAEPEVRAIALEALISLQYPEIADLLHHALRDPHRVVRKAALRGLGRQGTDADTTAHWVAHVQPLLSDLYSDVACQAAIALGRMGGTAAAIALSRELGQTEDFPLKQAIIAALGWTQASNALQTLADTLADTLLRVQSTQDYQDVTLCHALISAIGQWENPSEQAQAADILIRSMIAHMAAATAPELLRQMVLYVGTLGDRHAVDDLISVLAYPDDGVRLHVLSALKHLAPQEAWDQLNALAQDGHISPALRQGVQVVLSEWDNGICEPSC
jgi:HEAT repeat protein